MSGIFRSSAGLAGLASTGILDVQSRCSWLFCSSAAESWSCVVLFVVVCTLVGRRLSSRPTQRHLYSSGRPRGLLENMMHHVSVCEFCCMGSGRSPRRFSQEGPWHMDSSLLTWRAMAASGWPPCRTCRWPVAPTGSHRIRWDLRCRGGRPAGGRGDMSVWGWVMCAAPPGWCLPAACWFIGCLLTCHKCRSCLVGSPVGRQGG